MHNLLGADENYTKCKIQLYITSGASKSTVTTQPHPAVVSKFVIRINGFSFEKSLKNNEDNYQGRSDD